MLSTIVGDDSDGRFVTSQLEAKGIDTSLVITDGDRQTATYTAIEEPNGALVAGLA
ncbi:MAG TPA: carbohydrate kinase, partial [Rhizobiales bacterium]|nr:carbohydrate kinase [Hyphomicrobiales bacterium]